MPPPSPPPQPPQTVTGPTAGQRHVTTLLLLAITLLVGSVASSGSRIAVPLLALQLKATPFQLGAVLSCYAVLSVLTGVVIGRWIDRVGGRLPIQVGSAALCLGLLLPWAWPSLPALALCAACVGTGMSTILISVQHTAGALTQSSTRRTGHFTLLTIAQSVAILVSPPSVGLVIDHVGYRSAFLILAGVAALLLALVTATSRLLPNHANPKDHAGRSLKEVLAHKPVRRAIATSSLTAVSWELLYFFIPLHGVHLGLNASTIGLLFSCFSVAVIAIRLAVPWMSRRASEWTLVSIALGTAGSMFLIMPFANSAAWMMVMCVVLGSGMGISQPITMSIVYAAAPPGRQAEVFGIRNSTINLVQTAAPLALGTLSASIGLTTALWPFAVLLLFGARFAYRNNALRPSAAAGEA